MGGIELGTDTRLQDQVANYLLVFQVAGDFSGEIQLAESEPTEVLKAEVCIEAVELKAIVDLIGTTKIRKVEQHIVGADLAGTRRPVVFAEGNEVIGIRNRSVHDNIGIGRNEGEAGAPARIFPTQISHTANSETVVEIEAKKVHLAAVAGIQAKFAVEI